jgi:arylformamidase
MSTEIIDITYLVTNSIPKWPGGAGYSSKRLKSIPKDIANVSSFEIGCHYGTHLDAPLHFLENGKSIDQLELDILIGNAFVVEIFGKSTIGEKELEDSGIPTGCRRLLIKTDNQKLWFKQDSSFYEDFCALNERGAQWIVENNIELVGIDYLSIQKFADGPETHQILLSNNVIIVECLKLDKVSVGWYEMICLPMKLDGLEGAPVRAILKKSTDQTTI